MRSVSDRSISLCAHRGCDYSVISELEKAFYELDEMSVFHRMRKTEKYSGAALKIEKLHEQLRGHAQTFEVRYSTLPVCHCADRRTADSVWHSMRLRRARPHGQLEDLEHRVIHRLLLSPYHKAGLYYVTVPHSVRSACVRVCILLLSVLYSQLVFCLRVFIRRWRPSPKVVAWFRSAMSMTTPAALNLVPD